MKTTTSSWNADQRLLTTVLSGNVNLEEIEAWKASLAAALQQIPDNSEFKMFVNLHGFKATDFEAHKAMRTVIPLALADYNFRAGYVDLFENVDLPLHKKRGITCKATVHVHHDASKIDEYDRRFGNERERFFTDPELGADWINNWQII